MRVQRINEMLRLIDRLCHSEAVTTAEVQLLNEASLLLGVAARMITVPCAAPARQEIELDF